MKTVSRVLPRHEAARTEELLGKGILDLYDRFPELTGFSLCGLEVAEIVLQTWPGLVPSAWLREAIESTIQQIIDEGPDAQELVRDRTFARAWH